MGTQAGSACKEKCLPSDPAHIWLGLDLEAVGSQALLSDSLQEPSVRLTDLCCSLWVELARLWLTFSSRPNDGPRRCYLLGEANRRKGQGSPISV